MEENMEEKEKKKIRKMLKRKHQLSVDENILEALFVFEN